MKKQYEIVTKSDDEGAFFIVEKREIAIFFDHDTAVDYVAGLHDRAEQKAEHDDRLQTRENMLLGLQNEQSEPSLTPAPTISPLPFKPRQRQPNFNGTNVWTKPEDEVLKKHLDEAKVRYDLIDRELQALPNPRYRTIKSIKSRVGRLRLVRFIRPEAPPVVVPQLPDTQPDNSAIPANGDQAVIEEAKKNLLPSTPDPVPEHPEPPKQKLAYTLEPLPSVPATHIPTRSETSASVLEASSSDWIGSPEYKKMLTKGR